MAEGVLVLDAYGRIVDANPAGARLLALPRAQLVGRQLADLLPSLAALILRHRPGTPTRSESQVRIGTPGLDGETDLAVSVTGLTDPGRAGDRPPGRASRHHPAQADRAADARAAAGTDAPLPDPDRQPAPGIHAAGAGLRLVARSIPAGLGLPPGRTTARGAAPGSAATSTTSTRRAGAAGRSSSATSPARVCTPPWSRRWRATPCARCRPSPGCRGTSSDSSTRRLLAGDDDERFCTVAYGQVTYPGMPIPEPESLDGQDGPMTGPVRITLALGGHPQPPAAPPRRHGLVRRPPGHGPRPDPRHRRPGRDDRPGLRRRPAHLHRRGDRGAPRT